LEGILRAKVHKASVLRSLDQFATDKLATLETRGLLRSLVETARTDMIWVERGGRRLLSFSCNDYLNFSTHPAIKGAAKAAIDTYGVGAGASRLVTGNHPLFAVLEAKLAQIKCAEAACVFGSGYLANAGIIPALIGERGLLLIDELAHACLWPALN
jgi:8-amino-7-oxononanoate synthase